MCVAVSKAIKNVKINITNGSTTKNQDTPVYPEEHKKFKNHVHKKTKTNEPRPDIKL